MKARILFLTILAAIFMMSCNDDDDINISTGDLSFELPANLKEATVKKLTVKIENVNTGEVITKETTSTSLTDLNLEDGMYNITVTGITVEQISSETTRVEKKENETTGETYNDTIIVSQTYDIDTKIRGKSENIEVTGGSFSTSITMTKSNAGTGFVISEVFFAGTERKYGRDQFIEIYNNTNEILYADGLCIAETELMTTMSLNEYAPDVREKMLPVSAVYRIPGTGKEHPVKPGETIVLCDIGINHQAENANSVDLSKADFEWFDKESRYPDPDTPEVPNMDKIACTSATIWGLHKRGFTGYAIFRPETTFTADEFNTQYAYFYTYHFVWGSKVDRWMNFDAWAIPNAWVVDAVQCSTPSKYEWSVMSAELDFSWTHSGDSDDARYGHSVKRKIAKKEDNRIILQDTNDSASDFIATAPNPSPGTVEDHN